MKTKYPNTITIVVPNQVYDGVVYTSNSDCYIARELRKTYENSCISVGGASIEDGVKVDIDDEIYYTDASSTLFETEFANGNDVQLILLKL